MRLPVRVSGTLPATIIWARPSTTALLPTPGSPMSTGLFLVRRLMICMMRSISVPRPITGSSSPSCAALVRSRLYFSKTLPSAFPSSPPDAEASSPPSGWDLASASRIFCCISCVSTPMLRSRLTATPSPSLSKASQKCSVPTKLWCSLRLSRMLLSRIFLLRGVNSSMPPDCMLPSPRSVRTRSRTVS